MLRLSARKDLTINRMNSISKKVYKRALFLDNNIDYIMAVSECPGITIIKIPESDILFDADSVAFQGLWRKLSHEGDAYVSAITAFTKDIRYDPASGIQDSHIVEIQSWVSDMKARAMEPLAVLIDFDRTLTMMEGLIGPGTTGLQGTKNKVRYQLGSTRKNNVEAYERVNIEGLVETLLGGPERLMKIQSLFEYLYDKGVDIWILSNNSLFNTNKPLMKEILDVVSGGKPVGVICSHGYSSKRAALLVSPYAKAFREVCVGQEGGRKRKRGAKKTQRRIRRHQRSTQRAR